MKVNSFFTALRFSFSSPNTVGYIFFSDSERESKPKKSESFCISRYIFFCFRLSSNFKHFLDVRSFIFFLRDVFCLLFIFIFFSCLLLHLRLLFSSFSLSVVFFLGCSFLSFCWFSLQKYTPQILNCPVKSS